MQTETHTANEGFDLQIDVEAILSGSRFAGLSGAGFHVEALAVDMDIDALLAGSRFSAMPAAAREACLSADLDIDVDALVASGFAGRAGAMARGA